MAGAESSSCPPSPVWMAQPARAVGLRVASRDAIFERDRPFAPPTSIGQSMKIKINASLIALAIAALPYSAQAAGLGRINVLSALGQPLHAEIEVSATAEEQASLSARIAPPATFAASRINYSPALANVRVDVEKRGERSVISLRSDRPFADPFVDVLIELDWAAGRVVREYTFLLDPPELQLARNARQARSAVAEAPASPSAASTPMRPVPAPFASPAEQNYAVKRGDTLRRIAEQHRHPGVSLEQMLVAIYRQNPDAFDGNNMNRLRAGRILTLPSSDEAAAIPPTQARREVIAQASDFNAYRARMAAGVAAMPVRDESITEQQGGGRITPRVEEQARGPAGPRDEVKVSRTQLADGKLDPEARLRALEEDLAARDKAIDEANARLQALEETVRQMQRLLELRSQTLAAAQNQAAPAKPAELPTPAPSVTPSLAPTTPAETSAPPTTAKPAQPEGAIPEKVPAKPAPPQPEPGLVESLLADPMLPAAGGGILVLLLAYLGLQLRKRRAAAAMPAPEPEHDEVKVVQAETAGGTVNTAEPSVLNTDFGRAGLAIDADEGVDPVAEADVYIAYGRDAQAEEILLDALKAGADRPAIYLKLLEIYAQRGSVKPFESIAGDLYARTNGQGEDWAKAAAMGRKLDPNNPLYAQAAETRIAAAETPAAAAVGAAIATGAAIAQVQAEEKLEDLSFDFDLGSTAPAAPAIPEAEPTAMPEEIEAKAEDDALSFDVPTFELNPPAEQQAPLSPEPAAPAFDEGLTFSLSDEPEPSAEPEQAALPAAGDQGLSFDEPEATPEPAPSFDLSFDLDQDEQAMDMSETIVRPLNLDDQSMQIDEVGEEAAAPPAAEFAMDSLDFELDLSEPQPSNEPESEVEAIDLTSTFVDLPEIESTAPEPAAEPPAEELFVETSLDGSLDFSTATADVDSEAYAETETKLELARAYEDMGDKDGARELLAEVLAEGSPAQQDAAREMLARLD